MFDDIVIGSGLSALGAVLGLDPRRRVLIAAGPTPGVYTHYTQQRSVPCDFLGPGGLGNDWHGVIPLGLRENFGAVEAPDFATLFAGFYPRTPVAERIGEPLLFVPWRPIRPAAHLARLAAAADHRLTLRETMVTHIDCGDGEIRVRMADGSVERTHRLWIGAGALRTPALLEAALGKSFSRGRLSDHVVCYVGVIERRVPPPQIERTRDGVLFQAYYDAAATALYTLRPARFAFRELDYGFEQRAIFGMPTGSVVAKILRRMSPGLLAEAFYNRAGVFPKAGAYSVYAQTVVEDAYEMQPGDLPLRPRLDVIASATAAARVRVPFEGVRQSQRPELYIPGIHLHCSIDVAALAQAGVGRPGDCVQVIDASPLANIGPDHHSFKMMLRAFALARAS